ncbi:MAG: outer membrane beta-barrel protein, partial [Bacteroidales bacterium]|nr:outer membrane beta-barrel protein [Bacteroidales bacterium]
HKISKNEEKERVLDVRTKSKPQFVLMGNALAGGGFDTDSTYHKFRYTAGVDVNAHSEKLQASFSANINNINNASNRRRGSSFGSVGGGGSPDLRYISVSTMVNKKWMSPTTRNFVLGSVGASYSYTDNYNVSESITQLVYFPNEKYDSRVEDRSSRSDATSKAHNFSVNGFKSLKDGGIRLSASARLNEGLNHSWSSNYNLQDDLPRQGTSTSSKSGTHGKTFSSSVSANKRFRDKIGLSLRASASLSDSDGDNLKIDTTTSSISRKVIDIGTLGASHNWSVTPSVSWEIDDGRTLSASFGWSDSFSRTERLAYDISDPLESLMDTVNTYTHTTDNNTRSATLSYRSFLERSKAVFDLNLNYRSLGINKQETFPFEDLYDHRFRAFLPSANLTTQSMINHWSARYSTSSGTPSVEQIRPRIDNSSLYNVTAGNPDLQQSFSHSFNLSYSTVLGAEMRESVRMMEGGESLEDLLAAQAEGPVPGQAGGGQGGNGNDRSGVGAGRNGGGPGAAAAGGFGGSMGGGRGANGAPRLFNNLCTFSANAGFSLTQHPIVSKRIYYAQDTYLPVYDYTMPAQSTFRTWENAPDGYSASASARIDIPLQKIRWFINTSLSLNWDNNPSYIDEVLTRTQNLRPTLRIGLRSNFSRNVRINLNGSGSYVYSYNDLQDKTSYFTERLNAGWEINNIFQHLFLGGNYSKSFTQGLPYARIDDNIFDLRAGGRFGPRNNVEVTAAVHDLFNKTQGFSTSMNSNYVTNSWVHQFGRYVLFSVSYRFNSLRKGNGGSAAPGGPGR